MRCGMAVWEGGGVEGWMGSAGVGGTAVWSGGVWSSSAEIVREGGEGRLELYERLSEKG